MGIANRPVPSEYLNNVPDRVPAGTSGTVMLEGVLRAI